MPYPTQKSRKTVNMPYPTSYAPSSSTYVPCLCDIAVGAVPGAHRLPGQEPGSQGRGVLSLTNALDAHALKSQPTRHQFGDEGSRGFRLEDEGKRKGKCATVRRCRPSGVPPPPPFVALGVFVAFCCGGCVGRVRNTIGLGAV